MLKASGAGNIAHTVPLNFNGSRGNVGIMSLLDQKNLLNCLCQSPTRQSRLLHTGAHTVCSYTKHHNTVPQNKILAI